MTTKKIYGTWAQPNGIEIDEVDYDGDTHDFEIYVDGCHVVTIYADSPEETEGLRAGLDAGDDVRDWFDADGVSVGTLIDKEKE